MMTETAVESSVCEACGADVRDGSLFCYNCGGPVGKSAPDTSESAARDEIVNVEPATRPPLRSAASLRKQRRAFNRQPVEVRWESPSGSPTGFVIATIVLAAGALVLLIIALYLH